MVCIPMPSPARCSESRTALLGRLSRDVRRLASRAGLVEGTFVVDSVCRIVTTLPEDREPERLLSRCF
jgi:hypothetical protein